MGGNLQPEAIRRHLMEVRGCVAGWVRVQIAIQPLYTSGTEVVPMEGGSVKLRHEASRQSSEWGWNPVTRCFVAQVILMNSPRVFL